MSAALRAGSADGAHSQQIGEKTKTVRVGLRLEWIQTLQQRQCGIRPLIHRALVPAMRRRRQPMRLNVKHLRINKR